MHEGVELISYPQTSHITSRKKRKERKTEPHPTMAPRGGHGNILEREWQQAGGLGLGSAGPVQGRGRRVLVLLHMATVLIVICLIWTSSVPPLPPPMCPVLSHSYFKPVYLRPWQSVIRSHRCHHQSSEFEQILVLVLDPLAGLGRLRWWGLLACVACMLQLMSCVWPSHRDHPHEGKQTRGRTCPCFFSILSSHRFPLVSHIGSFVRSFLVDVDVKSLVR